MPLVVFFFKSKLAGCCADFIWMWCQDNAITRLHHRLHPSRHGEGEALHEGGEEEEKLHLGQGLPGTYPFT